MESETVGAPDRAGTYQVTGTVERAGVMHRSVVGYSDIVRVLLLQGSDRPMNVEWADGSVSASAAEVALTQAGDEVRMTFRRFRPNHLWDRPDRMEAFENLTFRRRLGIPG